MSDVADTRRKNLALLVERDGLAVTARRFGRPDRQINDMIAGRKSFGEKIARAMEENYARGRPAGWLDQPHEAPPPPRDEHHSPPENDSPLSLLADTRKSSEARESKNDKAIRWPLSDGYRLRFEALPPEGRGLALAKFEAAIQEAEDRYPAAGQANSA